MSFIKKGVSHEELSETIESLEAQLKTLYHEKELYGAPQDLSDQVVSLTEQLKHFYSMQEQFGSLEQMATSLQGLQDQLASFYSEVEHGDNHSNETHVNSMVDSLEKQVISLIDERNEIQDHVNDLSDKLNAIKSKSRDLGAALFEAALFDKKKAA